MCHLIKWLARLISSIGAINWGLEKFYSFNLVDYTATMVGISSLEQILYGIVAIAGLIAFVSMFFWCSGVGCGCNSVCKCAPCEKK